MPAQCSVVNDGVVCSNAAHYANPVPMCPKHYQRWKQHGDPAAPVQVQVRGRSEDDKRERRAAWVKKSREKNPEARRASGARYRAEHPGKSSQWYHENKERHAENGRRWRQEHPEAIRGYVRRWVEANPEKAREKYRRDARRRKARRRLVVVVPYKEADIFERDKWVCQLCRKKVDRRLRHPDLMAPTIDHIIPISQGGADAPFNVQLAHFSCNSAKGVRATGEQLRLLG